MLQEIRLPDEFIISGIFASGLFCDTLWVWLSKTRWFHVGVMKGKCKAIHHEPPIMIPQYRISPKELDEIIESLDGTGGWLIKERELRYWIEKKVNDNLNKKPC